MKFSKLTRPELEEILKNANFTDEEVEVFELLVADKSLEEVSQRLLISKTTTSRMFYSTVMTDHFPESGRH